MNLTSSKGSCIEIPCTIFVYVSSWHRSSVGGEMAVWLFGVGPRPLPACIYENIGTKLFEQNSLTIQAYKGDT